MKFRKRASVTDARRSFSLKRSTVVAMALAVGCSIAVPLSSAQAAKTANKTAASTFDLNALIAQAKAEGSLTVWDSSSSVLQMAAAFQAEYGITVNAQKVSATTELTKLQALSGSSNPGVDVVLFATGPALVAQLINQGIVKSYVPPDLDIPTNYQNPLVYLWQPAVFYYNKTVYGNHCPINNVWQLTESKYRNRVALADPTQTPEELEWFSEMAINGRNQLAAAYKKEFGKAYTGTNAGYTFIQDLAANAPLVESSLDNVLQAVAGPGVANPAIGLAHGATYADAKTLGYNVAICRGLSPWIGYMYPKFIVQTSATTHPAAAQLFIHFAEIAEGDAAAADGGGQSGNLKAARGIGGPPGILDEEKNDSDFLYLRLKSLDQDFKIQTALSQLWSQHLAS